MCYGTRVVRTIKELEEYYDKEAIYGEMEPGTELTYHYANGFSHPNMWILPQERKENLYVAIIKNLDARTFKISARDENEASAILNDNLIGDDYIVEDFALEKEGVSQKKRGHYYN